MLLTSTTLDINTNIKSDATSEPSIEYGDVNNDGIVDCFDLVTVRKNMNNNIEYKYDVMPEYFLNTLTYYVLEAYDTFNINMVIDNDNDGITNWIEIDFLNTSPDNDDTDKDGLPDKYEIASLQSDPTVSGTDATDDVDNDGLSNIDEYLNGTEPLKADSDSDGVSDYDELKVYKTNPIMTDTDEDGLDDYSELQLNLNPLLSKTHGDVLDSEYKIEQSIPATSKVFSDINTEDSPYEMSIKINTNGYAEKELSVTESGYSHAIDSDAIIGSILEISTSERCSPDSMTIEYKVDKAYQNCTLSEYSNIDTLKGINNLCIFKYFEEINMLLPVETKFNGDIVYTETDELGTYCLVDLSKWFNSLNIPPTEIKNAINNPENYSPQLSLANDAIDIQADLNSTSSESASANSDVRQNPIDIVFLFQRESTLSTESISELRFCFNLIKLISQHIFEKCSDDFDVRIYLLQYSYNPQHFRIYLAPDNIHKYAIELEEINHMIDSKDAQSEPYTPLPFDSELYGLLNLSSNTYIYQFANDDIYYPYDSNLVNFYENNEGVFSLISDKDYTAETGDTSLIEAIEAKQGLYITDFLDDPSNSKTDYDLVKDAFTKIIHHFNLKEELYKYDVLVKNRLNKLVLADELNKNNNADTDGDGITDWDELNSKFIEYDSEGKALPCTLEEIIDAGYAGNYLYNAGTSKTGREQMMNSIRSRKVYVMKSDPTKRDSDGDGLYDNEALFRECEWGSMPVAPADTSLMHAGPKNMWKEHIEQMMNYDVPTEYMENQKGLSGSFNNTVGNAYNKIEQYIPPFIKRKKEAADIFIYSITGTTDRAEQLVSLLLRFKGTINKYGKDIRPYILYLKSYFEGDTVAGAYLLNFIKDENGVVYHSQPETWQKEFGYNDLYDDIFRTGSYMNYGRVDFHVNDTNYTLWAWKGDYWNLQSGAEIGLYVRNDDVISKTPHFDVYLC